MIEVENLVKRYGSHTAVNGLSFKVEQGQIYGFLGPNGAGKSTTMNIITGYIASTEGTVRINGHDILEEPQEARKCIGYLPEQPPLYFDMTVQEYMEFVADLKKIPKNRRSAMIDEIMQMTKIKDMKNRLIKNLSKGYRQRVGLAQAVMGYPEIIILDEPTVGLDPKQIIEIRDLIKGLAKKHTVILSSHILSEVSAVCDYVMIIAKGELVASDTPENLTKKMQSCGILSAAIKGDIQNIEAAVKTVNGLESWELTNQEDGTVAAVLQMKENMDPREEIFYALAEAKCPILMMKQEKASLEDVFLELTSDANQDKSEKGKRGLKKRAGRKKKSDDSNEDVAESLAESFSGTEEMEEESAKEIADNMTEGGLS